MSNFRSVAAVTATLQSVLQSAVQGDVSGATVTTVRPGEGASANLPGTGINLYLYQVGQNPYRSNDDLPTRRAAGDAMVRPAAALDLYYLMSFYGDDLKLEPQRLLGSALGFLHAQPQLTRAQIQAAVSDASKPFLAGADLASQPDVIRLAPTGLTLDELSRLWSVFLQTPYVLSTTFRASTVLLERPVSARPALPAQGFRVAGFPLRKPAVTAIVSQAGAGAPIVAGSTLVVQGGDFSGDGLFVDIDGAPAAIAGSAADQIVVPLPATLKAGPHALLARLGFKFDPAGPARPSVAADLATFALQPQVAKAAGAYDVAVSNVQGAGAAPRSAAIAIGVTPGVGAGQTATLELLGPQGLVLMARADAFADGATRLTFQIASLAAGNYVARLRVDGAPSPVDVDGSGAAVAPKVALP